MSLSCACDRLVPSASVPSLLSCVFCLNLAVRTIWSRLHSLIAQSNKYSPDDSAAAISYKGFSAALAVEGRPNHSIIPRFYMSLHGIMGNTTPWECPQADSISNAAAVLLCARNVCKCCYDLAGNLALHLEHL